MSEQPHQGAGYPQPTSGQPAQGYQQQPYASPQAQYQQQAYGYAASGPSMFDKLGVPFLPAILALSGLGGVLIAQLLAGLADDSIMRSWTNSIASSGVQSMFGALFVMVALTMFLGPKLRKLWQSLALVAGALIIGRFLFEVVSGGDSTEEFTMPDGEVVSETVSGRDTGDPASWIAAILLLAAIVCLVAAALLNNGPESEEAKAAKAQQAAAAQAAQQQQMQAYQTGQVGQPGQPQQHPSQPQQPPQPGQPGQQQWPQQ